MLTTWPTKSPSSRDVFACTFVPLCRVTADYGAEAHISAFAIIKARAKPFELLLKDMTSHSSASVSSDWISYFSFFS